MKYKHRIPPQAHFVSDPVTPQYQAEVDRTMARAAARVAEAERRLAAAEAKLAKALRIKAKAQQNRAVLVARELVELRRQELLAVQRMASASPAGSAHRGRGENKQPRPGMHTL